MKLKIITYSGNACTTTVAVFSFCVVTESMSTA